MRRVDRRLKQGPSTKIGLSTHSSNPKAAHIYGGNTPRICSVIPLTSRYCVQALNPNT
jgi:hypothetical protein